jgi:proline-rich tail region repeat protein
LPLVPCTASLPTAPDAPRMSIVVVPGVNVTPAPSVTRTTRALTSAGATVTVPSEPPESARSPPSRAFPLTSVTSTEK